MNDCRKHTRSSTLRDQIQQLQLDFPRVGIAEDDRFFQDRLDTEAIEHWQFIVGL